MALKGNSDVESAGLRKFNYKNRANCDKANNKYSKPKIMKRWSEAKNKKSGGKIVQPIRLKHRAIKTEERCWVEGESSRL